jgi:hypothetical protein
LCLFVLLRLESNDMTIDVIGKDHKPTWTSDANCPVVVRCSVIAVDVYDNSIDFGKGFVDQDPWVFMVVARMLSHQYTVAVR